MNNSVITKTTTRIQLEPKVTPEMLVELRARLGQSLTEFGETLQKAIPSRKRPFSRKYISALEHGRERITEKITGAYYEVDGRSKSIPAGTAGGVIYNVVGQPGQLENGDFIPRSARSIQCSRPGCTVRFIKTHPRQKYHDPECK